MPELRRVAEEVSATGEPRILRRDGEDLAVVRPVRRRKKQRMTEDERLKAFREAAGSWSDVDTDAFIEYIYAARHAGSKPPIEL